MPFVKSYDITGFNIRQAAAYAGIRDQSCRGELEACYAVMQPVLRYSVCYDIYDISVSSDTILFSQERIVSKDLADWFSGCSKMIVFAATVGIEADRLIHRYSKLMPSKALLFQAIGAQQVERLCDAFCGDMSEAFSEYDLTGRYSPGYGDLALEQQRNIFQWLKCEKYLGITLTQSDLIIPSKSVTAFAGMKKKEI